MTAAQRIERVVTGVVRQALLDAGESTVVVQGEAADAKLLRAWCAHALGDAAVGAHGLNLHPASKTSLLLGECPAAAVLPFGDLYYSEVVRLAGTAELPDTVQHLVGICKGAAALDDALRKYFDERMPWPRATQHLSAHARAQLEHQLQSGRFRRARLGLIPKLGARTLGIDLYS